MMLAQPPPEEELLDTVRFSVREVLERTPSYRRASPAFRRDLARKMVEVSLTAAEMLADDARLTAEVLEAAPPSAETEPEHVSILQPEGASVAASTAPMSQALAAGDQFSGVSAAKGAEQLMALKDAIDFPTYVRSLITGVFEAITLSNVAQLEKLGDLLDNVAASQSAFSMRNISDGEAARWLVSRFPYFRLVDGDPPSLELKDDVELSEKSKELQEGLEATAKEVSSIMDDELLETIIPLVRRKMGRDKQAMMATMVMLGLQRVVVDQGRLHASMDMRVDTRSISEQRAQSRFDTRVNTSASGSFGMGPWGAKASVSATVGYVKSDEQYSKEELASQAGLRSSVDLVFRTEQVPLGKMASGTKQQQIAANTNIPAAEWTKGDLLEKKEYTKHQDFGEVPDAPKAEPTDPLELAKLNLAKD